MSEEVFFIKEKYGNNLYSGAHIVITKAIADRIKQMNVFVQNLKNPAHAGSKKTKQNTSVNAKHFQKLFLQNWPQIAEYLSGNNEDKISLKVKEKFIKIMQNQSDRGLSYLEAIGTLAPVQVQVGKDWLDNIVEDITTGCLRKFRVVRQQGK